MKVLLIQLRRVGDILLTTPAVTYLKTLHPDWTIDFLAEPMGKPVLENHPHIDHLFIYDKDRTWNEIKQVRARKYDVVIDFLNNPRSRMLTMLSGARWRVGFKSGLRGIFYNTAPAVPSEPEYVPLRKIRLVRYWLEKAGFEAPPAQLIRPVLYPSNEDREFSRHWLDQNKLKPKGFMVMAPVSRRATRQWRPEGFRTVGLEMVRKHNMPVYLAWGPGEEADIASIRKGVENELQMLPPTTTRQMGALFREAALVLTNNSGAMHLSIAVGTPTVSMQGPTRPLDWNPSFSDGKPGDVVLTVEGLSCLGCRLNECPIGHLCMKDLKESTVLNAVEQQLKKENQHAGH